MADGWRVYGWDPRRRSNDRYLAAGRLQFTARCAGAIVLTHEQATDAAARLHARREQGLCWTIEPTDRSTT
jgi:hypothetical protein